MFPIEAFRLYRLRLRNDPAIRSSGWSVREADSRMKGLKDRIAVVTGAASGIGHAVSRRLRDEGAVVVMADIVTPDKRDYASNGPASEFVRTDVTCRSEVAALIDHACARHGRIDILVNNAGIPLARSAVDTTEDDWNRVMDVNLRGVFLCAQAAIAHMRRRSDGVIVNVASELGIVGARDCAAYCASKGGVIQLTRAMAVDHGAEGIRVNCVCPGPVETPLLDVFLDATGDRRRAAAQTSDDTLLGRLGKPDEIAGVVAFLASADAAYMTGAVVVVDGGITAR